MRCARVAGAFAMLVAFAATAAAGCGLDDFCREGDPGCAVDACANQLRDGDETDVDCGGSCAPCPAEALCVAPGDCADDLCVGGACCPPPCVLGTTTFGGPEQDQATDALVRPDGTVILVGETAPGADFGPTVAPAQGGTDIFVTAVRPDGTLAWGRRIGGPRDDYAPRVIGHDDGRLWIFGSFQGVFDSGAGVLDSRGGYGDVFLIELTADGTPHRARSWSSHGYGASVGWAVPTPDGGAIISNRFHEIEFTEGMHLIAQGQGDGASDVYVARLDPDGEPTWAVQLGGTDDEFLAGLALAPDGAIMVALDYRGDTDLNEVTVPAIAGGGDFAIALLELDPDSGAARWARSYPPPAFGTFLHATRDDGLLLAGVFGDDADFGLGRLQAVADSDAFVARFTRDDGTPQWMVPFPGGVGSVGRAAIDTPDGDTLAAVQVVGDLAFESGVTVPTTVDGIVLVGIDPVGQVRWAHDGAGIVVGTSVGLREAPGGALAFGGFAGTLTLGTPITTRGKADAFVSWFVP